MLQNVIGNISNKLIKGVNSMRKCFKFFFLTLTIYMVVLHPISGVIAQQDSDNDGLSDDKEQQLALLYKPVLHFAGQEKFFPTDVNYHIDNSHLILKQDDTNILVDNSPTSSSIAQYTSDNYFLNNTLDYEQNIEYYEQNRELHGDLIYSMVTRQTQFIIVQYWFFYAYNPGILNQHQGDWEMIQIVLDSNETPLYAVYSQHHAGQRANWEDVEKFDQTHPRIYIALGSHANYFRSYQGKLGIESDIVENSITIEPDELEMIILREIDTPPQSLSQDWLLFGGRWGNWNKTIDAYFGSAGPSGPLYGENAEKWINPISWGSDKFEVTQTWFTASFIVYNFLYIFAIILGIRVVFKVWKIIKGHKQNKLNILRILRSKAVFGVILGIIGIIVYFVALFVPWYLVTGNVQTSVLETVGKTELVLIDGVNGVRVNMLQNNQGLTTLFGLGIPFSIIFVSSVFLNFLDIIAVEKPKNLSKTYIIGGITSLIPVIIIIIFIVSLTGLVSSFAGSLSGGQPIPDQVSEMVSSMSQSPFMGRYSDTINSSGNIDINWGLAIGSYLFIVASVLKIAAGLILRLNKSPE